MATLIEYLDHSDISKSIAGNPDLTTIGYLTANPDEALRCLLPNFYVADYLGIHIPSRSDYDNRNQGLKISHVDDGIGLVGTIEMLNQSELFRSCKHEPLSDEQKEKLVEKMKSWLFPLGRYQEPLQSPKAETYAFIFDVLGNPISAEDLINLSTHEDYYKPICRCFEKQQV